MKKGFTLVELLAVLVILGLLATITVLVVRPILTSSKDDLLNIQISNIEKAAKVYYLKEGMNQNKSCVSVDTLVKENYIDENEVLNPKDKQQITGSVKITYKNNKYRYKYSEEGCLFVN